MSFNVSQKTVLSTKELLRQADFDNILKCVHCGLCLDNCPTYRELGDEKDSPRGRLYLMRGLWEGELELEAEVIDPLNRCLNCRACESACPSGVPYGELLEKARGIILENTQQSIKERILRLFLLRGLFRSTNLLIIASWIMKIYAASGFPKLITNTFLAKLLPQAFVFQQYLLPKCSGESFKRKHADQILLSLSAEGKHGDASKIREENLRVGMFSGCIMDVSENAIHNSTLTLLRHIGCEVVVPGNQSCCGALHVHSGDRKTAREFALKNITAFNNRQLDAIITNAAGCGAQLQEYHHLFDESDEQTQKEVWSDTGWQNFENKVTDILEFLSAYTELLANLPWSTDEDTVLYDSPCHLMYAQKVDENPRKLLNSLPGVKLVALKESNWCCGSAGIYNLVQPELSLAILNRKTSSICQTLAENPKASTIVTANPGCLYQIRAGIRSNNINLRVLHPVVYMAERLMVN